MRALFLVLAVFCTTSAAQEAPFCASCQEQHQQQSEQIEAQAAVRTYYYAYRYYNSQFKFKGKTAAQTNAIIKKAYQELSAISGANFKPWTGRGPYHIIIDIRPRVGQWNALGQFEAPKTIVFSSGRDMKLNAATWRVRIAHTLIQHETFHFLRMRANPAADQFGHSKDKSCVFNINGTARYFCPVEVKWMQARFGRPAKVFKPVDKALHWAVLKPKRKKLADAWADATKWVNQRKPLLAQRRIHVNKRDASADPAVKQAQQVKIDALNVKIRPLTVKIKAAQKKALAIKAANKKDENTWKALINRWKNVPKAG